MHSPSQVNIKLTNSTFDCLLKQKIQGSLESGEFFMDFIPNPYCPLFPKMPLWPINALIAITFLIVFMTPFANSLKENEREKPIVPSAIVEAGRMLAMPEIVQRTHGFGQAIDGFSSQINSTFNKVGEKTMEKLRELKSILPKKYQALMDKAMQIFKEPVASEKEQWDKLIRSVESTNFTQEEKREFYEKLAAMTVHPNA